MPFQRFQETYQQKLRTADEAVQIIKSGDWVDYAHTVCTPYALDIALAKRMPELTDINIIGCIAMHEPAIFSIENPGEHFTWNSWHMSAFERKSINQGFGFYIPLRYAEMIKYYRENLPPMDVVMFQAGPMDKHGYFQFGPLCSHIKAMCELAKTVILEVNQNMPFCYGSYDNCIHVDDVDFIVEGGNPPLDTLGSRAEPSEVDLAIANLVVPEIPNGACLQLGIGTMPNAIGKLVAESDLKDLGVHTEMYVDAFVDMAEAGKITGARKPFDKGRQVYAFAAGSKRLYDYLDRNPACMGAPVEYVNDIARISQIDNFISINGTVDIDLYGQVSAESSGSRHISGAGGQQDFVMGAYLSKGGKSFICCSSTVKDKKTGKIQSRIRPTLLEGSVVTCTRTNLHWFVTEYGKFNVKGKSTWQRAEGLIQLAHPQFREELIAAADSMHIWRRSNKR